MSNSLQPHGLYSPQNSPGQNTGVGSRSLLQGIFPNPRIKPRSPTLQVDSLPVEPPEKPKERKEKNTGYPLQYSGLENSVDCIAHGVTKSQTRLSDSHFHCFIVTADFSLGKLKKKMSWVQISLDHWSLLSHCV